MTSNVIDFVKYKEDRERDEQVVHYIPYGLAEQETWHEHAAMRDDVSDFVASWMGRFNEVVEEIQEVVHDVDKLLGEKDQEPPL